MAGPPRFKVADWYAEALVQQSEAEAIAALAATEKRARYIAFHHGDPSREDGESASGLSARLARAARSKAFRRSLAKLRSTDPAAAAAVEATKAALQREFGKGRPLAKTDDLEAALADVGFSPAEIARWLAANGLPTTSRPKEATDLRMADLRMAVKDRKARRVRRKARTPH